MKLQWIVNDGAFVLCPDGQVNHFTYGKITPRILSADPFKIGYEVLIGEGTLDQGVTNHASDTIEEAFDLVRERWTWE